MASRVSLLRTSAMTPCTSSSRDARVRGSADYDRFMIYFFFTDRIELARAGPGPVLLDSTRPETAECRAAPFHANYCTRAI